MESVPTWPADDDGGRRAEGIEAILLLPSDESDESDERERERREWIRLDGRRGRCRPRVHHETKRTRLLGVW